MSDIFRFENLREESCDSIIDYWDCDLSFIENIKDIFNRSVLLPESNLQLPIVLAYSCVPSALCNRLPILCLFGDRGTGKSTLTSLIAAIHGQKILSAATTFAAIRNYVASNRWWLPQEQREEKNFMLLFDNVNPTTFSNEQLYTLFLNGYDRKTDLIQISKGAGENMLFRVFSPKVLSTVHQLFAYPNLSELHRRLMVIRFSKLDKMPDADNWLENRIDIENLDLSWLHREFNIFWNDEERCKDFVSHKRTLKKPKTISTENWAISHDIIATGLTVGLWENKHDAYFALSEYWDWINQFIDSKGALKLLLKDYIKEQSVFWEKGLQKYLSCKEVKSNVDKWKQDGKLELFPTQKIMIDLMADLGWTLGKFEPVGEKEDMYWLPLE